MQACYREEDEEFNTTGVKQVRVEYFKKACVVRLASVVLAFAVENGPEVGIKKWPLGPHRFVITV